jgi:recombination protein RecT
MLTAWLPEIKRALPKHLNADRMSRIALTAFRRTPKLAECDPRSVFAAVIQASQLGLEPDTLGRSYLIPYKATRRSATSGNRTWSASSCPAGRAWST